MPKKVKPKTGGAAMAKAVAVAMRKRDRRAWTIIEYRDAEWTHGYCKGERFGAWRATAGKLTAVKPPAILEVPYAQFCVEDARVLIESVRKNASGQGEVFELRSSGAKVTIVETKEGLRWRVGR